jgi:flagellar biosynthesis/type III secretory pathway chaperone
MYFPVVFPADASVTPQAAADILTGTLAVENRLLAELVDVMRRQREAVATDDVQQLDDSVFATHRVLTTLGEARRRRRSVNRMLGEVEELGIQELDAVLGEHMTPALRSARDDLQATARALSREVDINRRVLRTAMAASTEYMQSLLAPTDEPRLYSDAGGVEASRHVGKRFIDRHA